MQTRYRLSYQEMAVGLMHQLPAISQWRPDVIVPVMRGGLTLSHWLARHLNLPIVPLMLDSRITPQVVDLIKRQYHKALIVEDLIAEGRTFVQVKELMGTVDNAFQAGFQWKFMPYLIDATFPHEQFPEINYWVVKTGQWYVFPWEEDRRVVVGDRGLFRDGTDQYTFDSIIKDQQERPHFAPARTRKPNDQGL